MQVGISVAERQPGDRAQQQHNAALDTPAIPRSATANAIKTAPKRSDPAPMSAALAAIARSGGTERVDIIVRYESLPSVAELGQLDARIQRDFPRLGMAQVSVPAWALNALAVDAGVSMLALDEPLVTASSLSQATAKMPAENSRWYIPVASDVRVAVLDSGVSDLAELNVVTRMDCTAGWQGSTRNFADHFPLRVLNNNDGANNFTTRGSKPVKQTV